MLKIDISKMLSWRIFTYLAGFLPGLYFGISILLAKPTILQNALQQSGVGLGYYTQIFLILASVFFIGTGFMFFVQMVQYILDVLCRISDLVISLIAKYILMPLANILASRGWRKRWIGSLAMYASNRGMPTGFNPFLREVQECWHLAATILLQKRYGIRREQSRGTHWGVWYSTLGIPKREDIRSGMFQNAMHACGWSGLLATRIVPILTNPYYLGLSFLLILGSILSDWHYARRRIAPILNSSLRLRTILGELRQTGISATKSAESKADDEVGALTIED